MTTTRARKNKQNSGCIVIPEVIFAKEAVILSSFYGDVDRSCYVHVLQKVTDVDGLVGG